MPEIKIKGFSFLRIITGTAIFFICLSLMACSRQPDRNRDQDIQQEQTAETPEKDSDGNTDGSPVLKYLTGTKFSDDMIDCPTILTFDPAGNFELDLSCMETYIEKGKYEINGDIIILKFLSTNYGPIEKEKTGTCRLINHNKRSLYSKAIDINITGYEDRQLYLYDLGSSIPEGKDAVIDGVDAVSLGKKKGITTKNVRFRKKPDTSGEEIEYIHCVPRTDDDGEEIKNSVIPENNKILILARTKEKHKIENRENYWYYIHIVDDVCIDYGDEYYGWVFGEFISVND